MINRIVCYLTLLLALGIGAVKAADGQEVSVLGLGVMGKALVQCFSSKGYSVHAWNRGEAKRKEIRDLNLSGVTVYEDMEEAGEEFSELVEIPFEFKTY